MKESMTNLKVAFSPCPNDTFIFHAWLKGLISSPINIQPVLEDVQTLNELAMQKRYPVSKISCYCLGLIEDEYQMLSSGAALGYGCGPKIIAKDKFPLEELGSKRIAIPGRQTTAHFLLDLLAPKPIEKRFCSYNEIADLIRSGAVDCGLIIHESRFTFAAQGFNEIADLGTLWEAAYQLPLPLGCIVAKRSLGKELITEIDGAIHQSVAFAKLHPEKSTDYIIKHSLEKAPETIYSHISTYVTEETLRLTPVGKKSIELLLQLSKQKQLNAGFKVG